MNLSTGPEVTDDAYLNIKEKEKSNPDRTFLLSEQNNDVYKQYY